MKFAIITHVPHGFENKKYYAYSPYVREMNIWSKFTDEFIIVAPLILQEKTAIEIDYHLDNIDFISIKQFNFLNFRAVLNAIFQIPKNAWIIFKAMKRADHIHLRCPGNMGLLGCFVQVFFPNKKKTAKYAGNWDPKAIQPLSYKLQKWILSNTFLTKNMEVLVYGEWKNQSKNVKPFFTATYSEVDKIPMQSKSFSGGIKFVFVGTLSEGKRPLYAIKLIKELSKKHKNVTLNIFGEGKLSNELQEYINENKLNDFVFLKGNQSLETIKKAYIDSHFVILPSKSEGWPKVVAEGMFWKCLPITAPVSCVSTMLDHGNRGVLLELDLMKDVLKIEELLEDEDLYNKKLDDGFVWSRKYTVDFFEEEIKKLVS